MIQVASFKLPEQEEAANFFLATHKPDNISTQPNLMVVYYEDGTNPVEYQVAALQELIAGQANARIQQEVALFVSKRELADTPTNMARYDELTDQIKQIENALELQDAKTAFVQSKIDSLTK